MKTEGYGNAKRLGRRLIRMVSLLFWVLLGGAMVWLAVTRWNGVPADPSGATSGGTFGPSIPIDPAIDRTQALSAALGALPPAPALTLPPPPPGEQWSSQPTGSIDVSDALRGDWTPESRPVLKSAIAFLETPAVEAALAQIALMEPGGWRPYGPSAAGIGILGPVRHAAKLFLARARYHHAARNDVDAALVDLASTYRLAATVTDSGALLGALVAMACVDLANSELVHLAREHALTRDQATRFCSTVRSDTLELPGMWQAVWTPMMHRLRRTVDLCWTDDGNGHGWLALSHLQWTTPVTLAPNPRSGAWNVLSPFFNDRQTALLKIGTLQETYETANHLPYHSAIASLEMIETRPIFNLMDGPLALDSVSQLARMYEIAVRADARRSAALVTVGLSAYRHDHGVYPASLGALLDGYLDTMPLDPYSDEALRYRPNADAFILYSVGRNGVDDDGRKRSRDAASGHWRSDGDVVYTDLRSEPAREPKLEDVTP